MIAVGGLLDITLTALVVAGTTFALIGSFGLARLSTFLLRLHGPTKATTLGVGCVLLSSAIWFTVTTDSLSLREVLIAVFLFLTAPLSAMMLARAAARLDGSVRPPPPPDDPERRPGERGSARYARRS